MRPIQIVMAAAVLAAWWRGSAAAQDIFVPPPRSQGDSIAPDAPQPPPAGSAPDTVRTLRGSELSGRVVAIDAEGRLLLADPLGEFSGQVTAPLRSLEQVRLAATESDDGPDALSIINGDSIVGTIVSIDPETVIIRSPSAGQVTVRRRVISQAGFQGRGGALSLNSDFASGRMDPWKPVQGNWKIEGGRLTCAERGSFQAVAAGADQKDEPVTVEAVVEGGRSDKPSLIVSVFCDDPQRLPFGRNSVWVSFDAADNEFSSGVVRNGNQTIQDRQFKRFDKSKMTARLTYEPNSGRLRYWADGELMGETVCQFKPADGKFILLGSYYPCRITSIRVSGGVPPSETPGDGDAELTRDAHLIEFSNNDRLTVRQVALAENSFTLTTTAVGQVQCEAEKILGVVFTAAGRQPPRRQAGDVTVQTATSRFTFQLKGMDGETLIGHSDYMGEVKIRRSAIRSIRFNLYPE